MAKEGKKWLPVVALYLSCVSLVSPPALAVNQLLVVGGVLPRIELPQPQDAATKRYLGLAENQDFTVSEIEAEVVIIEVFSMY